MSRYSMSFDDDGRPRRRSDQLRRLLATRGAPIVAIVLLLVLTAFNSYTYISPGKVAVVKNNITGAEEVRNQSGLVIHLPFGMTDVFQLDRKIQVFEMSKERGRGDRPGIDNVRIKVADGSNVEVDVAVNYRVIPASSADIIKNVGPGDAFKNKMIRSYTRAFIREKYGTLTLEEIANPATRIGQNTEVRLALNDALRPFGIEVTLINTTNFDFNEQYEKLVKEKKAVAQQFTNQKAAQEQAQKEQEAKIAAATRMKRTALIQAGGVRDKNLVEATNNAKQTIARAKGEAYARKLEGDRNYEVAINEASAIEAEGLAKAAGIRKLVEAYADGGLGLVKEALAKKLVGSRINGRPYSLSERIDRLKIEGAAAVAVPRIEEDRR